MFYMLIGLGENMTCYDVCEVGQRSEVKVTRVLFVKKCFSLILLRTFCHRASIVHMLIGFGRNMIPIVFGFTRLMVKVTSVTGGAQGLKTGTL